MLIKVEGRVCRRSRKCSFTGIRVPYCVWGLSHRPEVFISYKNGASVQRPGIPRLLMNEAVPHLPIRTVPSAAPLAHQSAFLNAPSPQLRIIRPTTIVNIRSSRRGKLSRNLLEKSQLQQLSSQQPNGSIPYRAERRFRGGGNPSA